MMMACSSDHDKNSASEYQGTYLGANLDFSINGVAMKGKALGINEKGELILQYIIPGETVVDIPLSQTDGWLQGSKQLSDGSIDARGRVENKKLFMNINIKVDSPIVGKWKPVPFIMNQQQIVSSPVYVNASPADAIIEFMGKKMSVAELTYVLEKGLSQYILPIESLNFNEDGFLTVSFVKSPIKDLLKGLLQYYTKDNTLYLYINLPEIYSLSTSDIQSRAEMEVITQILNLMTEGIPMSYSVSGNKLTVYLNEEALATYMAIIKELLPLLPNDNNWVKEFKAIFPDLYNIFNVVKDFEIGMELEKL